MEALRRNNAHRLVSGEWTQVGRIAFRTDVELSDHLRRTVLARELDGRSIIRRRFEHVGAGTCDVLIDAGVAVLRDPVTDRYLRVAELPIYDSEYVRLRTEFARHIPSPRFTVEDAGRVLSEESLDGATSDPLEHSELRTKVLELVDAFLGLLRTSAEPLSDERRDVLGRIHAGIRDRLLGEGLDHLVDRTLLEALLLTGTAAPGKGPSLGQNNLMVVDGRLHCIDFQFVTLLPGWSDPAALLVSTLPSAILEETSGDSVGRILEAAAVDHEYRGTPAERAALVLATIAVGRIRIDRPDPLREAERRGIEPVVERSVVELQRDWSTLLSS